MALSVKRTWVVEAARVIVRKIGAALADVIHEAVEESVFDGSTLEAAVQSNASTGEITEEFMQSTRLALLRQIQQLPNGPEHDDQANRLYVEMLVRVVGANAMFRITLKRPSSASPVTPTASSSATTGDNYQASAACATASMANPLLTTASNRFVQGLLHAFETMQEVHMMDRSYYRTARMTKAQLHSSAETPGWDTVPLMTLVHLIQRAAQTAGSAVNDEALTHLVRSWRKLLLYLQSADKGVAPEFSRRRGALSVVNGLLIILFQHNNTHQCRALLQSVEHNESIADTTGEVEKSVLRPAAHMIAEVVKFRYYQGRIKLYERNYKDAFLSFQMAYRLSPPMLQCSSPQRDNKLRIHFYWVAAGIVAGQQPPAGLLESDSVTRQLWAPLIDAIREGNPAAFCRALDRHSSIFRRRGVYMLMQQARILCYLYLLQRVHQTIGELGADNSQISVSLLVDAAKLVMQGVSVSDAEGIPPLATAAVKDSPAEEDGNAAAGGVTTRKRVALEQIVVDSLDSDAMCLWLARLISRGFVRGYLSYEHQRLVLSKALPFPTIFPAAPSK